LIGLGTFCATSAPPSAAATGWQTSEPSAQAASATVPIADHHQHLVSPAGAEKIDRTLPPIVLPPDLADLLRRRAALAGDEAALSTLYTSDATMWGGSFRDWLRGPTQIADYVAFRGGGYALTPTVLQQGSDYAHISGYFTASEGGRHGAAFSLLARREVGTWRIAAETFVNPGPRPRQTLIDGSQLVAMLDLAGIRRAAVLSTAFWYDSPARPRPSDYLAQVRAENDWTAAQVARFPARLVAFCSFSPLESYAEAELRRCMRSGRFKGIKLHLGSSGVNLSNAAHIARVRSIFALANRLRAAIIVHTRTYEGPYESEHIQLIIDQFFAAAPDVPITVAHLWGGEAFSQPVLDAFATAVRERRLGTHNLYFDISDAALVAEGNPKMLSAIATAMRSMGLERMLYGSDAVGPGHPAPKEAWEAVLRGLPLTQAEFAIIAGNVAPYLR
jgi:predicted TIM-barrel fold metal-dependent hydrolase